MSFNPRSRVGSDTAYPVGWLIVADVSIHAPVWGATYLYGKEDRGMTVSIHAPVWGATRHSLSTWRN